MNYSLLQDHIDDQLASIVIEPMKADGSNVFDFYCADVVGNRKFVQNFGGYPRSEVAELMEAQTLDMQRAILNSMVDYSSGDNPTAGMSDAEIMLGHKSRYQQTPSEMQQWLEGQLQIRDAKRAQLIAEYQASRARAADAGKKGPDVVTPAEPE